MHGPTSLAANVAQSGASGFTAAVLTMVGVPPLSLLWGGIGALAAVLLSGPESPRASILSVLAAALLGAAGGYGAASWIAGAPVNDGALLVAASTVIGAGAKTILAAAIAAVVAFLARVGAGGAKSGNGPANGGEGGQ